MFALKLGHFALILRTLKGLFRQNFTVVVHLAAALWRLTNGAGTFGAWKIGA